MKDISELRQRAERGDADAQNELGCLYRDGWTPPALSPAVALIMRMAIGRKVNEVAAVKFFKLSANQGNASAQKNLADMYAKGLGVEQDEAETAKWYRKAAAQGDTDAQEALARMTTQSGALSTPVASPAVVATALDDMGDVLLRVKRDFGSDIFNNVQRLKSVLMDYAPKMAKERRLLVLAVECGAVTQLRRGDSVQQCTHMLVNEMCVAENVAQGLAEALAKAIRGG